MEKRIEIYLTKAKEGLLGPKDIDNMLNLIDDLIHYVEEDIRINKDKKIKNSYKTQAYKRSQNIPLASSFLGFNVNFI